MVDRPCLANDPWRSAVLERIRATDVEAIRMIVAELRKVAGQLLEQANGPEGVNRLQSLSFYSALGAAQWLAGVFDCYPNWESVLPCLLRWQYAAASELDGPASRVVVRGQNPVTLASGEEVYRDSYMHRENEVEMPPGLVYRHYIGQALRWSQLIDNAATMIEVEARATLPPVEPEEPIDKQWFRAFCNLPISMTVEAAAELAAEQVGYRGSTARQRLTELAKKYPDIKRPDRTNGRKPTKPADS